MPDSTVSQCETSASVVCHFFGGPWDGRIQEMERAPFTLVVPVLGEVRYTPSGVDEVVPTKEMHYRKRGPVLAGHAYYDHMEG